MMLLAVWLQDLERKEMKQGHCLRKQRGRHPCLHQKLLQQMLQFLAMEKEVFLFYPSWFSQVAYQHVI